MNAKEIMTKGIEKVKTMDHIPVGKILAPIPVIAGMCTYEAVKRAIRKAVPPCFYRTVAESVLASSISGYGMMLGIYLWMGDFDIPLRSSVDEDEDDDIEIDPDDPLIKDMGMTIEEVKDLGKKVRKIQEGLKAGTISAIDAAASITTIMDGCSDEVNKYLDLDGLKEHFLNATTDEKDDEMGKLYHITNPKKDPEKYQENIIDYVKRNAPHPMTKEYFMSVWKDLRGDVENGYLTIDTVNAVFKEMVGPDQTVTGMTTQEIEELYNQLKKIIEAAK